MGRLLDQTKSKTPSPQTGGRLLRSGVKPTGERTVKLTEQVGGGSYKTSGPGSLILTKRSQKALPDTYSTDKNERDHIVPVALGGVSEKENLQYLNSPNGKEDTATRQQGKTALETQAIEDYKNGKLSLPQARLLVMTKNQQIKGLIPKQGVKNYLLPALKETVVDPIKQGVKDTGNFIKNAGKALLFSLSKDNKNRQNIGKDFIQGVKEAPKEIGKAGKDIAQSTTRAVASTIVDPVQTIRGKDQVYTPKGRLTQALLGKEPIKGIFKEQADTQNTLGKTGEKLGLKKGTSALLAGVATPLLLGGLKSMDLTPFGSARKGATKAVVKELAEQTGKDVLKKSATVSKDLLSPIIKSSKVKNFIPPFKETFKTASKKQVLRLVDNKALTRYGEEGKTIFNKIKNAEKVATFDKSKQLMKLDKELKSLPDEHALNFKDYVEGTIPTPPEAQKSVSAWKEISNDVATTAKEAGLTIKVTQDGKTIKIPFNPRENYYPQIINDKELKKAFSGANYEKFVNSFAAKNDIPVAKAKKMLETAISKNQYGNLERPRLGNMPDEVLQKDPRIALPEYINKAYDRLSIAKEFGGDDKILDKLVDQARKKGLDSEEIYKLTNRLLGREKFDESAKKVSSGIRAYNNITKLSLAAVTNLGDIIKTPTRTNITSTLKGIYKSFTKKGKTFAGKAGVLDPVLDNFAKETGIGEKLYKYTGFKWTESKLRQITANASKNYIDLLAIKLKKNPNNAFARRRLEQFDLNPESILKNGLSDKDYSKGAIKAISDLQPTAPTDIPHYWQSPGGKVITQYKTFAYKQMKFAKEFIYDESKKGNLKPLITFLIAGQAVGEGVADLKAAIRGRERETDPFQRIVDNYMTIGGVGMVTDFIRAITDDTQGSAFMKFVGGPTLSDLNDYLFAIKGDVQAIKDKKKFVFGKSSNKGERQTKTGKKVIGSIPVVGPFISNKAFPTKEAYKARTPGSTLDEDILDQIRGRALPENNDPLGLYK